MAALYAEAGNIPYDNNVFGYHPPNRECAIWLTGLLFQAIEGGMNDSAFERLRQAWVGVRCSNFGTSQQFDGLGSPRRTGHTEHEWLAWRNRCFGDMFAPVFYSPADSNANTVGAVIVDRINATVPSIIGSFGGRPASDVAPWIELTGNRFQKSSGAMTPELSKGDSLQVLRHFRSMGVREFLIWNHQDYDTRENWSDFANVVSRIR